jgi:hypothetical protein
MVAFTDIITIAPLVLYGKEQYDIYENTNKIFLPTTILDKIANLQDDISFLLFQLNDSDEILSVADFIQGDIAYVPSRFINSFDIIEARIKLYNNPIEKGTYAKIRIHNSKFMKLDDYKEYLEQVLQKYSVLSQGSIIQIDHHPLLMTQSNQNPLYITITKTEPEEVILITDTDLAIEFEEFDDEEEDDDEDEEEDEYKKEDKKEKEQGPQVDELLNKSGVIDYDFWHKKNNEEYLKMKCLALPYELKNKKISRGFINFNFNYNFVKIK